MIGSPNHYSSRLVGGVLFLLSSVLTFAEGDGKIIAVYGEAASAPTAPPGWSFLWNAGGAIGDSSGYVRLDHNDQTRAYGVNNPDGTPMRDKPGSTRSLDVYSTRDKDGSGRYYIASYTLEEEPAGEIWINNGNLRNKSFPTGTVLMIYVNDKLRHESLVERDRFAKLFQYNLGELDKGDSIRVAVGPAEKANKGGGRLLYTIEEHRAGETPGEPINILSPSIDSAAPQRGYDGKIAKWFSDKHKEQCETLLARKPELIFIGDSITARWPPEVLEREFGKYRPVNLGVGGDWVQNVLWRVENGVLDQVHPKVVVLLIGTNNISGGFNPDELAEGVANLLNAIHRKAPESKILLQGILPRGATINETPNEKVREANVKLALLADDKTVFYLDAGEALVEPDGSISAEVMPDRLHVAGPGYDRWLTVLRPKLDQLLKTQAR